MPKVPSYSFSNPNNCTSTTDSRYWYLYIKGNGEQKMTYSKKVDICLVGGGAGGHLWEAGGGGGGMTVAENQTLVANQPYTFVIGAGGSKGTTNKTSGGNGQSTTVKGGSISLTAGGGVNDGTGGSGTIPGGRGGTKAGGPGNGPEKGADGNYPFGDSSQGTRYGPGGGGGAFANDNARPGSNNPATIPAQGGLHGGGGGGGVNYGWGEYEYIGYEGKDAAENSGGGGGSGGGGQIDNKGTMYHGAPGAGGSGIVIIRGTSADPSSVTLSSSTITPPAKLGATFTNSELPNLTHEVTWSIGSYSYTTTTEAGTSYAEYEVPLDWIKALPSATSGKGKVTVVTKDGAEVCGTTVKEFTQKVPESVVPTLTSLSATRIDNDVVPDTWGVYVKTKSGVTLTAVGAAGSWGSSISNYRFTSGSSNDGSSNEYLDVTKTSPEHTIPTLQRSGELTYTVTVTDTRGRTAKKTVTIHVYDYATPSISSIQIDRTLNNGEVSDDGTYLKILVNASRSSCNGKNPLTISSAYKAEDSSSWTTASSSMTSGTAGVYGQGKIDMYKVYQVQIRIKDQFSDIYRYIDVPTAVWPIFFKAGGNGVSFGMVANKEDTVEVNPDWHLRAGDLDIVEELKDIRKTMITGEIEDTDTLYRLEQDSSNKKTIRLQSSRDGGSTWETANTITTQDTVYNDSALKNRVSAVESALGGKQPVGDYATVSQMNDGDSASAISISTQTTTSGYLKSYTIKQGSATVGVIDIPKDMVVTSGSVVTNPSGLEAGTYIKLVLANVSDPLYINVGHLVDIYKAKASASQVQIAIDSSTREISASIVAGSIGTSELKAGAVTEDKIAEKNVTKSKLSADVQSSLSKADNSVSAETMSEEIANAKNQTLLDVQNYVDEELDPVLSNISQIEQNHNDLVTQVNGKAPTEHQHVISDIRCTNYPGTFSAETLDDVLLNMENGLALADHVHNYAGSSSHGGPATSALKLTTNAGGATQPVYFVNGVPKATTYTLGKTVPSDAVFTDTTYSVASTSADGLMSKEDKVSLNTLATSMVAMTISEIDAICNAVIYTGEEVEQ